MLSLPREHCDLAYHWPPGRRERSGTEAMKGWTSVGVRVAVWRVVVCFGFRWEPLGGCFLVKRDHEPKESQITSPSASVWLCKVGDLQLGAVHEICKKKHFAKGKLQSAKGGDGTAKDM